MTYELLFTFFAIFTAAGLSIWWLYELLQCFNWGRRDTGGPDILPKPRQDRVVQTYKDHWKVELITKGDYK